MATSHPSQSVANGPNESSRLPQRPTETLTNTQSTSAALNTVQGEQTAATKKRRNHRGGRKKRGGDNLLPLVQRSRVQQILLNPVTTYMSLRLQVRHGHPPSTDWVSPGGILVPQVWTVKRFLTIGMGCSLGHIIKCGCILT